MKIAWVGTGIMGKPMAKHLSEAGHKVSAYNRTFEKALELEPAIKVFPTIEKAIKDAEVIFVMVGYPKDVLEVFNEVFKHAQRGTIIIDMTTSDPKLAKDLYIRGKELDIDVLDAPVTGGEKGAIDASLSIMVGGEKSVFETVLPLLDKLGKKITYMGSAGQGQMTKLANQIAIAGTLAGVTESLVFALENNLDLMSVHTVLSGGSAASNQLAISGLKMINNDYQPGFYIKHFYKDLNLAIANSKTELPILIKVRNMLEKLINEQYENLGTQALILYYLDSMVIDIDKS